MAKALNHYVQAAQMLPPWADARKFERAEKLFMDHSALSCILLLCASLPECYVVPDLSSVLHTPASWSRTLSTASAPPPP